MLEKNHTNKESNNKITIKNKQLQKEHNIPEYDFFDGKCCVCEKECNEMSGWKCMKCENIYCDEHNTSDFNCECK